MYYFIIWILYVLMIISDEFDALSMTMLELLCRMPFQSYNMNNIRMPFNTLLELGVLKF